MAIWKLNCPSCGADLSADSRYAHIAVCGSCESAVVVDEKAARISGKMAALAPAQSGLRVGSTGTVGKQRFRVVGRVRYGYDRGYWDEWFLEFEGGDTGWFSEDEGEITLEEESHADAPISFDEAMPGGSIALAGETFHIDEKGHAVCEGGEGVLPFEIVTGEKVPFLDVRNDDGFATVEFDQEGIRIFRGRAVEHGEIEQDDDGGGRSSRAGAAPFSVAAGARERVSREAGRTKRIRCDACGAPLEVPAEGGSTIPCSHCGEVLDLSIRRLDCPKCGDQTRIHGEAESVVCGSCSTVLDVGGEEPTALQKIQSGSRPRLPILLGMEIKLSGTPYRVVGHIRFVEKDTWGTYHSDEFLLHAKGQPYRWLTMENGHYSLTREVQKRPDGVLPRYLTQKNTFSFLDQRWTVFETGRTTVEFVDGELPFVAQVGDQNLYVDAISPPSPLLLSTEYSDTEAEWFEAKYFPREELAEAANITLDTLPEPIGIAPNQPYEPGMLGSASKVLIGFALLFWILTFVSWTRDGRTAGRFHLEPPQLAGETFLEEGFEIYGENALIEARFHAPVDNEWMYLDVAIVDAEDRAVHELSAQLSYYHGYSGGESWSEGSQSDAVMMKMGKPGRYRILVAAQGGRGNANSGAANALGRSVKITIHEGVWLMRYFFMGAIFLSIVAAWEPWRRMSFEKKRWAPVTDDDDD